MKTAKFLATCFTGLSVGVLAVPIVMIHPWAIICACWITFVLNSFIVGEDVF